MTLVGQKLEIWWILGNITRQFLIMVKQWFSAVLLAKVSRQKFGTWPLENTEKLIPNFQAANIGIQFFFWSETAIVKLSCKNTGVIRLKHWVIFRMKHPRICVTPTQFQKISNNFKIEFPEFPNILLLQSFAKDRRAKDWRQRLTHFLKFLERLTRFF